MSNKGDGALNLRKFPEDAKAAAKRYAGARGLTLPEYFARLVALHDLMIEDMHTTAEPATIELLERAGLEPVTR